MKKLLGATLLATALTLPAYAVNDGWTVFGAAATYNQKEHKWDISLMREYPNGLPWFDTLDHASVEASLLLTEETRNYTHVEYLGLQSTIADIGKAAGDMLTVKCTPTACESYYFVAIVKTGGK